jgi:hypothetical protein
LKTKRILTNDEYVSCPYCIDEGLSQTYKLKFISNNHLVKIHNKTFDDLLIKYPDIPTMTKDQSEKRSLARKNCSEKIKETYKEKNKKVGFADPYLSKKTKRTILDRYQVDNFMKTDKAKELFSGKNNPLSKENPQSADRRKKLSITISGKESKLKGKTYEEIYGEEKASLLKNNRSNYFRNKFQPLLEKWLQYFDFELIDKEYKGAHFKHNWKCKKCGTVINQIWNAIQQKYECPTCVPRFMGDSKSERELRDFISSLNIPFEIKVKNIIQPKELDIYIPNKNIAIEHNGIYRHREEIYGKSYHIKKTLACQKLGIQLIHIFEDEWVYKNEIVKERLKYILGLSTGFKLNARDCIIKEITNEQKDLFLKKFHIQGTDIGSSVKLGAFHEDKLVSVMTFSGLNITKGATPQEDFWELNRFCSDYNYLIRGIANKFIEYFKSNYKWKQIITYADRRWSNGNLYRVLGFSEKRPTSINYWYSKGSLERISRYKLRKRSDEPKDIPEHILRAKEGYFRIYGCGHLKFILENK